MTKRSSTQEINEVGENKLGIKLRPYAVEEYDRDYGLDFIVNLTEEPDTQDEGKELQDILSDHFFVQLKSTARFDPDTDAVHEDLNVHHLEQYIDQPIPVVLAIYDDNSDEIYWRVVQEFIWDHLDKENPNWRSQQTVRLKILRSQVITDYDRLKQAINRTQSRITRRQNQGLNIGEGIAFTPKDFTELEKQKEHDRLSYRGHTLLVAQQNLKAGNNEQAKDSITEILNADYNDEATVKALFAQLFMRNPAESDEAIEIVEFAEKARRVAAELDMETDQRLATAFLHIAGLFIMYENREEMRVTDLVQSFDKFDVPEYGYLRSSVSAELLLDELGAMGKLNDALSELLENEEYYHYAIVLPALVHYLAVRRRLQLAYDSEVASIQKDDGKIIERNEEIKPGDVHPIVTQAEQLADFVTENEVEANLRKSVGIYYYYNQDPEIATKHILEARELAKESGDTALETALDEQIQRIEEVPDVYDTSQYPEEDDEPQDRQSMAKMVLEMQGIEIDLDDPPSSDEDDLMTRMGYYAAQDADPKPVYKHCEHLRIAYRPSQAGKLLGMPSFGTKHLWCQYGGLISGSSLRKIFEQYKVKYCDGCEHHCPRSDDWDLTEEFEQKQVEDPDFKAAIEQYESAIMGAPASDSES